MITVNNPSQHCKTEFPSLLLIVKNLIKNSKRIIRKLINSEIKIVHPLFIPNEGIEKNTENDFFFFYIYDRFKKHIAFVMNIFTVLQTLSFYTICPY